MNEINGLEKDGGSDKGSASEHEQNHMGIEAVVSWHLEAPCIGASEAPNC
ncbi:MAG: hypothetical protein L0387_15140 [Acidobacteria bacterium]|nr:hypothetical protein [Acidobacteriota bacterium]MCI0722663.1 hypothetical protein [Acidobacteriota bacterium]